MNRSLYPEDQFPHGHANVATSLNNLGILLIAQGDQALRAGVTRASDCGCAKPSTPKATLTWP